MEPDCGSPCRSLEEPLPTGTGRAAQALSLWGADTARPARHSRILSKDGDNPCCCCPTLCLCCLVPSPGHWCSWCRASPGIFGGERRLARTAQQRAPAAGSPAAAPNPSPAKHGMSCQTVPLRSGSSRAGAVLIPGLSCSSCAASQTNQSLEAQQLEQLWPQVFYGHSSKC